MTISTKQHLYILSLASEIQNEPVQFMSQVRCLHLTPDEQIGRIEKRDASRHIDMLKKLRKLLHETPMHEDDLERPFSDHFLAQLHERATTSTRR